MALQVGDRAPLFSIPDHTNQMISLENYHGKNVVLAFFPLAFTSVCTSELCGLRDDLRVYRNLNAEILAISVDSPYTLKKFHEEQGYNFRLLSDFNKEVSKAYDSLYDELMGLHGVTKRSAFVIDGDGIIRYAEVLEDARQVPNFAAVQQVLAGLAQPQER